MQNKYIIPFPIFRKKKFREILKYCSLDETANKTSIYTKISRNTINKIYDKIRIKDFSFPHKARRKIQEKNLVVNFNWMNLIL